MQTQQHPSMATPCYPDSVAIEEYQQGDANTVYAQLKLVGVQFPERAREFAEQAAREVASLFCHHNCEPPILASTGSLEKRVLAAREHPGLCGVYHAGIIAGVEYNAVAMRAATVTYKGLRNQAWFDASQALNARGRGAQVARKECFTEACRALFPGEAQVED